jgi:hypothetical protein
LTNAGVKRSIPAGTGVCVVKTLPAAARSRASAKERPFLADDLPDSLETHERGVPLVQVPDRGPPAHGLQGAQPADAEHDLLPDARFLVAAVEARGDLAVVRVVLLEVRVEEEQRDASHGDEAHENPDVTLADRHGDGGRSAPFPARERHREPIGVERRVHRALPLLAVDQLVEVAARVEETDADQREAEIARGLQVVAGEDPQAAGVDGQDLGQAELGGEVGDEIPPLSQSPHGRVRGLRVVFDAELGRDGGEEGQEGAVGSGPGEPLLGTFRQERDGVSPVRSQPSASSVWNTARRVGRHVQRKSRARESRIRRFSGNGRAGGWIPNTRIGRDERIAEGGDRLLGSD